VSQERVDLAVQMIAFFFSRRQPLICFSRAIASEGLL
jgi:hypothetical protein